MMRAALVATLALVVAVPVGVTTAAASSGTSESLSIQDGRGVVVLRGSGVVVARVDRGEVQITDLTPLDQWSPRVNGVPRGRTVWTKAKDINLYIPGGRYRIVIRGEGISLSARGQGVATLDGVGLSGTYAVGDDKAEALPDTEIKVQFGTLVQAKDKP